MTQLYFMSGRTEISYRWSQLTSFMRWQTSRTTVLFLCFCLLSLHSRLRQSAFFLTHNTQIYKAVLLNITLILRRRQSVLYRRWMNRPWVWVYPRNQRSTVIRPCVTVIESTFEWVTDFKRFAFFYHLWQKETLASEQRRLETGKLSVYVFCVWKMHCTWHGVHGFIHSNAFLAIFSSQHFFPSWRC